MFMHYAQSSSSDNMELIERSALLDRISIAVFKSIRFVSEICERLIDERELEQERAQSQISVILGLRQKLIDVCPHIIENPHPKALSLLEDLILGVEGASLLAKKVRQRAGGAWTDNTNSGEPVNPMSANFLNNLSKIVTSWYEINDTKSDPDEAAFGSGSTGVQPQRNSRKRHVAEDEPPLIKFRRVDIIPNEAAKDPVSTKSTGETQRQFAKRLSSFNAPTLTKQRVRNHVSNMTINLSDDDEALPPFGLRASYRPPTPTGLRMNSGSSSSSSSVTMRPQTLYSDAVRLGQNGFPESRVNGHPNPINVDSLVPQEELRTEREHYLALLRNICHDKSSIRAINNSSPPPLQLLNRTAERSTSCGAILANNKPRPSLQQQQSPPPPKPGSNYANREFAKYAKLHDREQQKSTRPPPPLRRSDRVKSITSHSSTISLSKRTLSSSSSSNDSDEIQADDNSSEGQAAAAQANHTGTAPSKISVDTKLLNTKVSRHELMQRRFESCVFLKDSFAEDFKKKNEREHKELEHRRQLATIQSEKQTEARREFEKNMRSKIFQNRLTHKPLLVIAALDIAEEKKEVEFIPLTKDHMKRFHELVNGNPHEVIVSKFGLEVTRSDILTLHGSSWVNDVVINFYMNLLTERSELRSDELPRVYAMNTFFVLRLLKNGHGGVKRWTRRVDLFSKDIIPVPVHCNGVHWCMAIIHMRNKTIRYYDSMGQPNRVVLDALESYLRQECLDKRQQPFDTSDFRIESEPTVPQQTNARDCGIFSCMFAEYISRDAPITFSQDNMEYFRKKMALEIADGKLWN